MVTSILDCASYLRGRDFIVECDHQALRPLFQKRLKGAIYERWLAILQQFSFEIRYKPAAHMCVADALSRCHPNPHFGSPSDSPAEADEFFPFVPETGGTVTLPEGIPLHSVLGNVPESSLDNNPAETLVACMTVQQCNDQDSDAYDADTELDTTCDTFVINVPQPQTNQVTDNSSPDKLRQHLNELDLLKQNDYSVDSISRLQKADQLLHPLIVYLTSGELPSLQKEARKILLESADYEIVDGILFHSRLAKAKRSAGFCPYQLVLPHSLIKTVLELYHDSAVGAHGGIDDTMERIKEHYYFRNLGSVVSDYFKSCDLCQKRKTTKHHTKTGITALPTPKQPFDVWQVDLFGPLPLTPRGHTYVFTAIDMFSRYVYATPLANKDALTVSTAMFHLCTTFGVCETMISDLGTEFSAQVTQEVCRLLQVKSQFTPSFIHQCLGACERTHRTLAERLTPCLLQSKNTWDDQLPAVVFAMNNSVSSHHGFSPFEVVYGHRPRFPLCHISSSLLQAPKSDMTQYLNNTIDKLERIRSIVRETALK